METSFSFIIGKRKTFEVAMMNYRFFIKVKYNYLCYIENLSFSLYFIYLKIYLSSLKNTLNFMTLDNS